MRSFSDKQTANPAVWLWAGRGDSEEAFASILLPDNGGDFTATPDFAGQRGFFTVKIVRVSSDLLDLKCEFAVACFFVLRTMLQ
jgi:hypothetical protein